MKQTVSSLLISSAILLGSVLPAMAQYPAPGSSVTNAVTQNLSTGSGEKATLSVQYYDQAGALKGTSPSVTIDPKAVKELKTTDAPVPANFVGSAIMNSDKPLAVVVGINNSNVPGDTDGRTQGAYDAFTAGAKELYFPTVFRFDQIVTRLSVQNTESTAANITVKYFKRDGTAAGEKTATLNGFGQKTFYLGDSNDVPSNFPADFVDGSAYVISDKNVAGVATVTWTDRGAAYEASTPLSRGKVLYAPSHYRFINNAPANWASVGRRSWTLFSALNLQNTSSTQKANVKVTYTARGASTPSLVKNIVIEPLSAAGLNTYNGGDFPASDFNGLSKAGSGLPDWDGSVKIESDQDLVGVNLTNWGAQNYAGASLLVTENQAGNEVFLPAQYRLNNGGQWAQWSAINLMNIGTTTINASDITIEYISQDGTTVKSFSGASLPITSLAPGAAFGMNTRTGGDLAGTVFDTVGTSFIGGIYVKAPVGSKLVAIGNVVYPNRSAVYNGFKK